MPEIKMPDKDILGKAADRALDKISQAGYYVLKYGVGMPLGFAAELVGPATLWLPKVALLAAGYGLDKLGGLHPGGKIARLVKGLGEGLWKGGGLGLVTGLVADKLLPGAYQNMGLDAAGREIVKKIPFTENLAGQIHAMDIPSIIAKGQVGAKAVEQFGVAKTAIETQGSQVLAKGVTALKDNFNDTFGAAIGETANAAKDQVVAGANWAGGEIAKAPGIVKTAAVTGATTAARFAVAKTLEGAGAVASYGPQMSIEAKLGLGAAAITAGAGAIVAKEAREAGEAPVTIQTPVVEPTPVAPVPPTHKVDN
jgi:hypothetical protein